MVLCFQILTTFLPLYPCLVLPAPLPYRQQPVGDRQQSHYSAYTERDFMLLVNGC